MKSVEFCYWLQGYFEISGNLTMQTLLPEQVAMIKAHLAMVFVHEIDPSYPTQQKQMLDNIHQKSSPIIPIAKETHQYDPNPVFRC